MRTLTSFVSMMLLAGAAQGQPRLQLKGWKHDAQSRSRMMRTLPKSRTPGRVHLLVQFAGSPRSDQLEELSARGITVLSDVPDFGLSVTANERANLDGLDIRWAGWLQADEKLSPELEASESTSALVEFYSDVDPNNARAIADAEGLIIEQNPDLRPNHLLLRGTARQIRAIAEWDEVSYIFPASEDLIQAKPLHACAGALTKAGAVGQSVALIGSGWDGPGRGAAALKYAIVHLTDRLPADAAQSEIVRAFGEWAKYAKLSFTATSNAAASQTVAVTFASGSHGDAYPFDGPSGVVAHTFYPYPLNTEPMAGNMHFDDAESWRIGSDIDLFSIALHEAGHALGLGHSDNPGDVMYPYYRRAAGLSQNDIAGVLQLYAAQDGTGSPTPPSTPTAPLPAPPPPSPPGPPAPAPPDRDTTPPSLTIVSPSSTNVATAAASIVVSGAARDNVGVFQITWSSSTGGSGAATGTANWSTPAIPLYLGTTTITIRARDAAGNTSWRSLVVTRR